ncbi:hypothetical protein [Alicyclobacillus sp. ALC3]|uniref:hypothetical protein n=1 Tax=Alicyclobacillus sp. ALC3 TaxID=2796143 RepID=UPI00237885C6|nr:hypothetical protein [Alicyclobacillus sp. ALC3]WDL98881.1 hypothetical protein JC200_09610 [Alicyclobacillus sp. ALC3]
MNGRKSIALFGGVGISIVTLVGCSTVNHALSSSGSANTALSNQATTTSTAVKFPSNETLNNTTSSNQPSRMANTSIQTTSSGSKINVTSYSSSSDAVNAIANIEKSFGQVNPSGPPVDLGSGIKADFSGGAGTYSYKWHEGNWTILFKGWGDSSLGSQVAKSVVAYLHTHMLPAPETKGVITIVQPSSSNNPEVSQNTVAWQVANHVYTLKENGDPLKALETVVGGQGNQNPSNKPAKVQVSATPNPAKVGEAITIHVKLLTASGSGVSHSRFTLNVPDHINMGTVYTDSNGDFTTTVKWNQPGSYKITAGNGKVSWHTFITVK